MHDKSEWEELRMGKGALELVGAQYDKVVSTETIKFFQNSYLSNQATSSKNKIFEKSYFWKKYILETAIIL